MVVYAGETEAGERALAPFRAIAAPIADQLEPIPLPEMYPPEDEEYHPIAAGRTCSSTASIARSRRRSSIGPRSTCEPPVPDGGRSAARPRRCHGTRARRCDRVRTSLEPDHGEPGRIYEAPDEARRARRLDRGFDAALRQDDTGVYVNFLNDEGEERVHAAYPGHDLGRLTEIKRRYDPTNLFRLNQNIPPKDSA